MISKACFPTVVFKCIGDEANNRNRSTIVQVIHRQSCRFKKRIYMCLFKIISKILVFSDTLMIFVIIPSKSQLMLSILQLAMNLDQDIYLRYKYTPHFLNRTWIKRRKNIIYLRNLKVYLFYHMNWERRLYQINRICKIAREHITNIF